MGNAIPSYPLRDRLRAVSFALTVGLSFVLSPAAQAEEGDSYLCEVEVSGPFAGVIPGKVAFVVGTDDGGTMVYDPFIAYYFKEPIGAKLLKDSDARVTIQWDVKGIPNGEIGSQTLRYELSYLKGNKTARLRAKLAYGDTHEPTYPASCKREKWN